MKSVIASVVALLLGACFPFAVFGEEAAASAEAVGPAEPPYKVGDLLGEGGHVIELDEGRSMNFRMVGDEIRLYFLDEEGKIIEPLFESGSVRFADIDQGRNFYGIKRLPEDVGLGSLVRKPAPHRSFTILTLHTGDADEPKRYSFRYLPSMNPQPADSATDSSAAAKASNSKY